MDDFIEYDALSGFYAKEDIRPTGFSSSVYRYFHLDEKEEDLDSDKNICHGISFDNMKRAVAAGLNYGLDGEIEECGKYLAGITAAVLRLKLSSLNSLDYNNIMSFMSMNRAAAYYCGKIDNIIEIFRASEIEKIKKKANEFLNDLFNEPSNLRLGNPLWNSSVGSAFDPADFRWEEDDDGINVILSGSDSIAVTNMVYLAPDTPPFFYTFAYDLKRKDDQRGIASSDNTYDIPKEYYKTNDVRIIYFDYFKNQSFDLAGKPYYPN